VHPHEVGDEIFGEQLEEWIPFGLVVLDHLAASFSWSHPTILD
jgi:hypothetical protein